MAGAADRPRTLTQAADSTVTRRHACGTFFHEARPSRNGVYFPANPSAIAAVVVCLYNEQGPERFERQQLPQRQRQPRRRQHLQ